MEKKEETKIPTADEFIKDLQTEQGEQEYVMCFKIDIPNKLKEFAKLHVQEALKQAWYKSEVYNKAKFPGDINYVVDIDSILKAYPLENIK